MRPRRLELISSDRFGGLLLLWFVTWLGFACSAAAQQTADTQAAGGAPVLVTTSPEERVRGVLDRHCARCHERGRPEATSAQSLDYILNLDRLLSGNLVRPGRPDASRLYSVLLSAHVPQTVFGDGKGPTAEEIDEVRTWIESATPTPAVKCPDRTPVTLADLGRMLERLRGPGGAPLKSIRFISLAGYFNGCADKADMAAEQRAVKELVMAIRTTLVDVDLPLAVDNLPVLAVRLGDIGWHQSQWDTLAAAAGAPELSDPTLKEAYATATPVMDARELALAAMRSGNFPQLSTLGPEAAAFSRDAQSDLTVREAAADAGLQPFTLVGLLEAVSGPMEGAAMRLRQSTIPPSLWRGLRGQLSLRGDTGPLKWRAAIAGTDAINDRLDVGLWSDKISYKSGELMVVTAQVNRDCNLTVINVDTHGDATVLFPSDSDPDNAVKAGTKVRIPSDIEPYLLRASDAGEETFVAVCTLNRKRLLGVDQDFEKQRFSLLGNWRDFLKTAETREGLIGRRDTPRQRRARAKAAAAAAAAVTQPEQDARAAIYVKVE